MQIKTTLLTAVLALGMFVSSETALAAMTYGQALSYQAAHPTEIVLKEVKTKDPYGQKNVCRYFGLLGGGGVSHSGGSITGIPNATSLNLAINYGFPNIPSEPTCFIKWGANLAGEPDKGYEPQSMHIAFEDGYIKNLSLQGWEYKKGLLQGMLVNSMAHTYTGTVTLSDFDVYELSMHGPIASVSIDDGSGAVKHFFYSGDKDLKNKERFNKGLINAANILQINGEVMAKKAAEMQAQQEEERKAALRAEIEAEIKAEEEREALKKQIMAERAAAKAGK